MGGLRHRTLHVEVEDRLGCTGPLLRHAPPARIPGPGGSVSHRAIPHELDADVVPIGRPVVLEIVEEGRPVQRELIGLKVWKREGEAMVDADQGPSVLAQPPNEPLGKTSPCPVFPRARRWEHLNGRCCSIRHVNAQPLQACRRGLCSRVVDADISVEDWAPRIPHARLFLFDFG